MFQQFQGDTVFNHIEQIYSEELQPKLARTLSRAQEVLDLELEYTRESLRDAGQSFRMASIFTLLAGALVFVAMCSIAVALALFLPEIFPGLKTYQSFFIVGGIFLIASIAVFAGSVSHVRRIQSVSAALFHHWESSQERIDDVRSEN